MIKGILTSILMTTAICTLAQNDIANSIDSIMRQRYPVDEPGAAILIMKGDSIVMEGYYGLADLETKEPISRDTRFNIASISKQFTVVGVLQQVAKGKIDINQCILDYCPQFTKSFWRDIKLWHLMSHTSGLPDSRDRSNRQATVVATDETSMSYFPSVDSLRFTPGAYYDYMNPTFILLAKVIESVTGIDFITYQQKNIFNRAGMTTAYYFNPAQHPKNTAHGYITDETGQWIEYDYGEETFFATRPDGGIYATARDLASWEKALREGLIIPNELLNTAYSPFVSVSESHLCDYQRRPNTYYGLGWFIDTSREDTKVYHTGDNGGFQAYLAKYPSKDITIIVLENRNDYDRWQLATTIDQLIFGTLCD